MHQNDSMFEKLLSLPVLWHTDMLGKTCIHVNYWAFVNTYPFFPPFWELKVVYIIKYKIKKEKMYTVGPVGVLFQELPQLRKNVNIQISGPSLIFWSLPTLWTQLELGSGWVQRHFEARRGYVQPLATSSGFRIKPGTKKKAKIPVLPKIGSCL